MPIKRPTSGQDLDDILNQVAPDVHREITVRTYGGRVDETGESFAREKVSIFDSPEGSATIDYICENSCSFNHILNQENTLSSTCAICGKFLCSKPGCSQECVGCGTAICQDHAMFIDGSVFCTDHEREFRLNNIFHISINIIQVLAVWAVLVIAAFYLWPLLKKQIDWILQ